MLKKISYAALLSGCLLFSSPLLAGDDYGWKEIPNTQIRSVCPPDNFNGYWENFASRCHNVVNAWSGGAVDTKRSRLIVWGGGHSDYYGNELYALELTPPAIKRLTDPSPPAPRPDKPSGNCRSALADGNPNSRHTYDGLVYMAHVDKFFSYNGALACGSGSAMADTWTFDFATSKWRDMQPSGPRPNARSSQVSAYDPNTGNVFLHSTNGLFSYSYETNSYKKLSDYWNFGGMNAAIDPKRKKFVMAGGSQLGHKLVVYDIAPGSHYKADRWVTTGNDPLLGQWDGANAPGLAYDPVSDRMILWKGGSDVYSLNMDTKVWTKITPPGNPGEASEWGSFGRFDYVPGIGAFVVVNSVDRNAFTLRWAGTPVPAPTPTPTPAPTPALDPTPAPAPCVRATPYSPCISAPTPAPATVSGTLTVSVNALDKVGVQFKLDGVNLGAEVTTAPYSASWETPQRLNSSHTLTAVVSSLAPTPDPTPTSTPTPAPTPTPTPTPVPTPGTGGVFEKFPLPKWGEGPAVSMKHMRLAVNGDNGIVFLCCGDWGGPGGAQSYRQESYFYDIPNAKWSLAHGYESTPGSIVPAHPDQSGLVWDSKRKLFWVIPGNEEISNYGEARPTGTLGIKTFNPATKKWSAPAVEGIPALQFQRTKFAQYDPKTDQIIMIGDGKSGHLDLSTGKWTVQYVTFDVLIHGNYTALADREIWTIDSRKAQLVKYDIDTRKMTVVEALPFTAQSESVNVVYDPNTRALLFVGHTSSDASVLDPPPPFYVYWMDKPAGERWEKRQFIQLPDQTRTVANSMVFHPQTGKVMMIGDTWTGNKYFYLYSI